MKKAGATVRARVFLLLGVLTVFGCGAAVAHAAGQRPASAALSELERSLRTGDIIFQTSLSAQSQAIQKATGSKYSHCGLIHIKDGKYYVLEAVQPVKLTPLREWIARGKGGKYVVRRLKDADGVLTAQALERMRRVGESFMGKDYDLVFGWSDERIYCSELVWKMYQRATGVELGRLQRLGDFDLSSGEVRRKMQERYGERVPLDEAVISPAAILDSDLLVTVARN